MNKDIFPQISTNEDNFFNDNRECFYYSQNSNDSNMNFEEKSHESILSLLIEINKNSKLNFYFEALLQVITVKYQISFLVRRPKYEKLKEKRIRLKGENILIKKYGRNGYFYSQKYKTKTKNIKKIKNLIFKR